VNKPGQKRALLVHSDMEILSNLQNALVRESFITIVARDLSSALLAITQHQFQLAAVFADLGEPGAGWPLAGVLRLAFPQAFVCVLDQSETQVPGVRSAINYGVQQIYVQTRPITELVSNLVTDSRRSTPQ
jgi:DNA-binding response OmpR family regulator